MLALPERARSGGVLEQEMFGRFLQYLHPRRFFLPSARLVNSSTSLFLLGTIFAFTSGFTSGGRPTGILFCFALVFLAANRGRWLPSLVCVVRVIPRQTSGCWVIILLHKFGVKPHRCRNSLLKVSCEVIMCSDRTKRALCTVHPPPPKSLHPIAPFTYLCLRAPCRARYVSISKP